MLNKQDQNQTAGDGAVQTQVTSFVFCDSQYWQIVPNNENEFTYCTLQLTDEVLQLK